MFDTLSKHFPGDARFGAPDAPSLGLAHCAIARLPLHKAVDDHSPMVSEIVRGETVLLLDISGDWARVQCVHDHYRGYARIEHLSRAPFAPTHMLAVPQSHLYSAPDLKTPNPSPLYMGSRLMIEAEADKGFLKCAESAGGGFIYHKHVTALSEPANDDHVDAALCFLDSPYSWGGRTRAGIDCSGLVQMALMACGMDCPRDSDMQEALLGRTLADEELPEYGDLVFFPGHVGIMMDETTLLHANAYHMAVTMEPLADQVARLREKYPRPITSIRRL